MSSTRHRFIYNLRSETHDPFTRDSLAPAGFLLAPNNATATLRDMAVQVRAAGHQFYVDNGNFSLIGQLRTEFANEARVLWLQIQAIESALDRTVRTAEIPEPLRTGYRDLATRVRARALDLTPDDPVQVASQLQLDPTHLVGAEDITMAAWLSLDIEDSYVAYERRRYRRMNESVARRAAKVLAGLPAAVAQAYYPVASAVSYNTAFDAGKAFAHAAIDRISMGFGAYMADSNYADHVIVGRKRFDLGGRVPSRYLRTAAVATGFWAGYREERGRPPSAFHFLGLGAPIMMALVALAGWDTPNLSYDATSPIKDAVEGSLYVSKPAYLKIRTRNFALRLASTDGEEWRCPCPFCKDFVSGHPFDYPAGRAWHDANLPDRVEADDLRPGGGLADAYPLLSEPAGSALRQAVNFARIGHNHWVLEEILEALRTASASRANLLSHAEASVTAYEANTNAQSHATAVRTAFHLCGGNFP
jgi:hypothetical protein